MCAPRECGERVAVSAQVVRESPRPARARSHLAVLDQQHAAGEDPRRVALQLRRLLQRGQAAVQGADIAG